MPAEVHEFADLRRDYEAGLSLREVARKYRCTSPADAKRKIELAGGHMRPSGFDHQRVQRARLSKIRRRPTEYRGADGHD